MVTSSSLTQAFLLVTLCFALSRESSAVAVCNAGDKQALLTFKGQLIDTGKVLDPWKPTTNCCAWPGITCNAVGRVTTLKLLDDSFPNAPFSYKLKVKAGVKGAGVSLGALKELRELEFRNVVFGFAHPIPPQLGNLGSLLSLRLIGTQFIGAIPSDLGRLVRLSDLLLEGNRFAGGVPDSFGNLKALTNLQLVNNQLKTIGSESISLLQKLQFLDISNNLLSGPIPKWLGKLSALSFIQLAQNKFTGPIPGELCNIRGLKVIIIFDTQVSAIPPQIGNCAALTQLVLFDNKIAGKLPVELANLKKLERISVKHNLMSGTLPLGIGNLPLLTEFDVGDNKFSGQIPANYGPFEEDELSTDFSGNMFTGPIPEPMRKLRARVFQPGNPGLCGIPLAAPCKWVKAGHK